MRTRPTVVLVASAAAAAAAAVLATPAPPAPPATPAPKTSASLPALDEILEGYEKVVPADGGQDAMYELHYKKDTHDLLAVLPADYEKQRILLTNTLAGGFPIAGIQSGSEFVYWKRFGNRIALMVPELAVRTTGDLESRKSREKLYTDRVRWDMPIVAEGPKKRPVIDLDDLFIDRSVEFHTFMPGGLDTKLGEFGSIKVFPKNISLSVRMPWRLPYPPDDGRMMTLTFSLSLMPTDPGFEPREADLRVGYFHTSFDDLARNDVASGRGRYIRRWKLEKADPGLRLSPPREPIVFYVDHKTPIRYRRWVRDGILEWNKAFEGVGIVGAIEVYQQDARTGAHMEKDPEDVQYNFVVWNSNYAGFAIGPSRIDPRTGQVLDADVVFNDGWIRWGVGYHRRYLADIALEDAGRETLGWLADHPRWDPRVRLARAGDVPPGPAAERTAPGSEAVAVTRLDDAVGSGARGHGHCRYGTCRAMDLGLARLSLLDLATDASDGEIDGVPEAFIGPMVKDVIMHEIGHVLGLRHNFKGSTIYSLEQINSPQWREEGRPISGSVMDYNAVNYGTVESGGEGPYFMTTFGPYDAWAIRYGYAPESELKSILAEATRPEHVYLTDEDLYGPDPGARSSDLGGDALDFVDQQMVLVQRLRGLIGQRALKDDGSFQRARDAYMNLLSRQMYNLSTAVRYVGGVHVRRDRVGNADRNPTEVVSVTDQRRALAQVIRYAFRDDAFGLTPALLDKMSYDKWMDDRLVPRDLPDPQLDVHDLVLGVQASSMTALLDPTRLRRIFDNELRLPSDQDAVTLAELFETVRTAVWSELDDPAGDTWTARAPFISSLRRNLQREHADRLIDLALTGGVAGAVQKTVATLAAHELRQIVQRIRRVREQTEGRLDVYCVAHLDDAGQRIEQALSAVHVYE